MKKRKNGKKAKKKNGKKKNGKKKNGKLTGNLASTFLFLYFPNI